MRLDGQHFANDDTRERRRGRLDSFDFQPGHGQAMSEFSRGELRINQRA
jgi:hypothetical protein